MKILITGATGFLGGATAVALTQRGHQNDLCFLIRAPSPMQGLERLRESLVRFKLDPAKLSAFTESQIICGDLTDVEAFEHDHRLDEVTHVVNSAAVASFGNNPRIWPVNVDGTLKFAARMSRVPALQRFLHVGTAMACGPTQDEKFISERWETADKSEHLVTYTASKAEAERLMREQLPGLPLVVVRPSIIVGHSTLGCSPSTSIFWVFRMGFEIDAFMCDLDDYIDVVPVDYCAEAISQLLLRERLQWDLYHISAGRSSASRFRDIYVRMSRMLRAGAETITYSRIGKEDIPKLVPAFQNVLGIHNRRLLARALSLYGGFSMLHYVFDNMRLLAEGLSEPPSLADYVERCVESTRGLPLKEQMLDDFK